MQILSFRIKNFRSIIDTGWVSLSSDNLTALVGQNESGKTAVLSALAITLSGAMAEIDDIRLGEELPEIQLKTKFSSTEVVEAGAAVKSGEARIALVSAMSQNDDITIWKFATSVDEKDPTLLVTSYNIVEPDFESAIASLKEVAKQDAVAVGASIAAVASATDEISEADAEEETTADSTFGAALFRIAPLITLFEESSGLLPKKIDITDDFKLVAGKGSIAARNFLSVGKVDLKKLVESDTRAQAAILRTANQKVTSEFLEFWSQTIGKSSKLELQCSIHQHGTGTEKLGKPYLEFLIYDSSGPLYPHQRSRGTRWFMSFFLQMRASEMGGRRRFFLLDEPGSNLHEKAQADVLALLEKIKSTVGIVYSTHSPHLLDERSFHRILAVERDPQNPVHPTVIRGAHALGAASTDTLSPIFTAMGANLSRQTAIKKHNNVLLEELSGYYYLRSFWKLTACQQEVNLLPATGTSNVLVYANLFLGWGLDFIVVIDDEPSGRTVFKKLKRDLFLDDQKWAAWRMHKIAGCEGIEDIFHPDDYKKFVLQDNSIQLNQLNSRWAKTHGAAKAMHALRLMHAVAKEEVMMKDLHTDTQVAISNLVDAIAVRLAAYDRPQ